MLKMPLVRSVLLAASAVATASALDVPLLWIVNCTDTSASGWAHTAKGYMYVISTPGRNRSSQPGGSSA